MDYTSAMLTAMFQNDSLLEKTLFVKKSLFNEMTLVDGSGNVMVHIVPSVVGGATVSYANGDTGHLYENVYGSTTLDMPGIERDLVGRPSIFGTDTFSQGGDVVATVSPNFTGDGLQGVSSLGNSFSTSPDLFGNTQVSFSPSIVDSSAYAQPFDLQNSFSEIDAISSQFSAADLGSATEVVDGLDVLDLF